MQYTDDRHHWILDKSPYTSQPKTQTRRIYTDKLEELDEQGRIVALLNASGRTFLRIGQDTPIQPGRMSRSCGRQRIVKITKTDARRISGADAIAEGYNTPWHFLIDAWLPMHDPEALELVVEPARIDARSSVPAHIALANRPADRYQCYAITVECLSRTDPYIKERWGFEEGQSVLVRDLAEYGTILKVQDGKVLVSFGKGKPGAYDPEQVERT